MAALAVGIASLWLARLPGAHLGVLLCLGLSGAGLAALEAGADVPRALQEGGTAVLEGEVERVEHFEDSTRLLVAVARVGKGAGTPARFHASLYAQGEPPSLLPGQRVRVEARLKPLESALNPGEKDLSATRRRQGLVFTGSFPSAGLLVLSPPSGWRQELVRTQAGLSEARARRGSVGGFRGPLPHPGRRGSAPRSMMTWRRTSPEADSRTCSA